MKFLKPWALYNFRLVFPAEKMEHHMHVMSMDIILDDKGHPKLIEVESNPSMKVEYTMAEDFQKRAPKNHKDRHELNKGIQVNTVDLHVKSM